jgi:outer membrane biosynthesis protein TonB
MEGEMRPEKTELWLTLSWNDERLQSLRLDTPRPVWLGEDGDLILPHDVIAAPRLLLLTHAHGQWLHPDGRALALREEGTRQFGDFLVHFQLLPKEPAHLPLAWPAELAQMAVALLFAVALVALPLWLGGQQARRHLRPIAPEQELAVIVPLPAFIDEQREPEPPPVELAHEPIDHKMWFEPAHIDVPRPDAPPVEIAAVQPNPPQPNVGKTPDPLPKPRQSPTRVVEEDPRAALKQLDDPATPQPQPRTKLWGDGQPGDVAAKNGTDVPHIADLAAQPRAPNFDKEPLVAGPRKIATDGDPELRVGRQDVVVVRAPRPLVEGNGLDANTVQAVIQRMHGQLRHCLELGMLGGEKLNGRVRVAFVIAPDGSVIQAKVAESALHQPATEVCIADGIRTWKFPAAASGMPTRVAHGFVFRTK